MILIHIIQYQIIFLFIYVQFYTTVIGLTQLNTTTIDSSSNVTVSGSAILNKLIAHFSL
jgi:hypothetical protein